jgi:hypothetical protein
MFIEVAPHSRHSPNTTEAIQQQQGRDPPGEATLIICEIPAVAGPVRTVSNPGNMSAANLKRLFCGIILSDEIILAPAIRKRLFVIG